MTFGEYLKQLRNEKSISQRELADKSGISNAEISRIETGGRQKISPDVLRAFAPVLDVQYEELMNKAGYLNRSTLMSENKEAEARFIEIVTPKLIRDGWNVELCKGSRIGDILAKKDNVEWFLDFKYFRNREDNDRHFRDDMMIRETMWRTYGKLATYDGEPISKFTITVNSEKAYNNLLKFVPGNLKISISIMLLDFEKNRIVEEHQLT